MKRIHAALAFTFVLAGAFGASSALTGCSSTEEETDGSVKKDSSTGGDSNTGTDGSSNNDGGQEGGCFARLRPNPMAGPFCAFITNADGGQGVNCATGETCCYGAGKGGDAGFDPSSCIKDTADKCPPPSNNMMRPGDSIECAEKDDCTGNNVCCIVPATTDGGTLMIGMGTDQFGCAYLTNERGTRCKASCGMGELQGCQADSECGGGKTCSVIKVGSGDRLQMGYCK